MNTVLNAHQTLSVSSTIVVLLLGRGVGDGQYACSVPHKEGGIGCEGFCSVHAPKRVLGLVFILMADPQIFQIFGMIGSVAYCHSVGFGCLCIF